jgi:nucleotide-binding universal stress UspA family protein
MTEDTTMIDTVTAPERSALTPSADLGAGPIVVAVGGLDPASVLRAARILESREGGSILAATVVEPPPAAIVGPEARLLPPSYVDEQFAATARQLTEQLSTTGGSAVSWHTRVVGGEPAFALTDLARSLRARILVMGIGRHRVVDRVFGTETTLRAIRLAPCPVLAVHPDLDGPFHDVVVAVDFSPASAYAAQTVLPLLGPNATLHLVHVWQPGERDDALTAAANETYRAALVARFQRLVDALGIPTAVEVKTVTREGKPAERVLEYAKAHHADLVAAGRHGLNLLERLMVGSETTAMLRGARCSVLVAPEPPFAERDRLRLALAGTAHSTKPAEWRAELDAFTERNHGRQLALDLEDLVFGARVVETGFELVRAAYDPATERVELTVADPGRAAHRIMRVIGGVDAVDLTADVAGKDQGMRLRHAGGRTSLTFIDA